MLKQIIQKVDKGAGIPGFWAAEMGLCLAYFCLGIWTLNGALQHPGFVGELPSSLVLLIGSMGCAFFTWKRRNSARGSLHLIVYLSILASFVEDVLEWHAEVEGSGFPSLGLGLIVTMITVEIWLASRQRRIRQGDNPEDTRVFEEEDKL